MVGTWLWVVSLPDATFKGWGQGQAFQIRPYAHSRVKERGGRGKGAGRSLGAPGAGHVWDAESTVRDPSLVHLTHCPRGTQRKMAQALALGRGSLGWVQRRSSGL